MLLGNPCVSSMELIRKNSIGNFIMQYSEDFKVSISVTNENCDKIIKVLRELGFNVYDSKTLREDAISLSLALDLYANICKTNPWFLVSATNIVNSAVDSLLYGFGIKDGIEIFNKRSDTFKDWIKETCNEIQKSVM